MIVIIHNSKGRSFLIFLLCYITITFSFLHVLKTERAGPAWTGFFTHKTFTQYLLLPPSHFKCPVLTFNSQIDQIRYYFKKLKITFYSILHVHYSDTIFLIFKNYIIYVKLSQNLVNLTIQKSNRTLKMGWREYDLSFTIMD